jgi:lysyl-tRNA synthetase class I
MKIEFAPGSFDHFEGSQEELDALIAEITNMFENMTPEELQAKSREVSIEELLDDEELENIEEFLDSLENQDKRKLQ